ncbi:MAG: hypothetical protein IJA69_00820 [Clostridia bacterium]|nr:hypothetical protein [Clostridia bacterium]
MRTLKFQPISGCEDKIANINEVNCLVTLENSNYEKALFAILTNGEKVQLIKPMGVLSYPFAASASFCDYYMGALWSKHFQIISNGVFDVAINKQNFCGFEYYSNTTFGKGPNNTPPNLEGRKTMKQNVDVYATFKDGSSVPLFGVKKKYFEVEKQKLDAFSKQIKDTNSNEDLYL